METSKLVIAGKEINLSSLFISIGILCLMTGMLFGLLASIQFMYPKFAQILPFVKNRPLHVTLVITWIFSICIGAIYSYAPKPDSAKLNKTLIKYHILIFIATGIAIIFSYLTGTFGGREYWEFPPYFSIFIIINWLLFSANILRILLKDKQPWPIYKWMWFAGVIFFTLTFLESLVYLLPFVAKNPIMELTIQWKSYGALVGSWNLMVYGTAVFLGNKISGNIYGKDTAKTVLLFFLGLTNLVFNWAHHIYTLPTISWLKTTAYIISMTEWIILWDIIRSRLKNSPASASNEFIKTKLFLKWADKWIIINLFLALLISIPAINVYTHGTHITVAHAMGSTIGINTLILIAFLFFYMEDKNIGRSNNGIKLEKRFNSIFQFGLLIFFFSLIGAGLTKGISMIHLGNDFNSSMKLASPFLIMLIPAGIIMCLGLFPLLFRILKPLLLHTFCKD